MLVLTFLIGSAAAAQQTGSPPERDGAALRVFLACADCAAVDVRSAIGYVEWVGDSAAADVHVVATRDTAPAGGARYELTFLGRGVFAGRADTLRYVASAPETPAERGRGLVHHIQLGLVRYAAATGLARQLQVRFVPDAADAGVAGDATRPPLPPPPAGSAQPPPTRAPPPPRPLSSLRERYSGALGKFEPNPALRPERLLALETGLTTRLGGVNLQAVGFHQRLADAIVRTSTGAGKYRRENRELLRSCCRPLLTLSLK